MSMIAIGRHAALPEVKNSLARNKRLLCGASAVLVVGLLAACGGKEKPAGQSIARVNDKEITVHQLNEELQRIGNQQNFSNKQVLDALVDRQLLVNKAQDDKIDRDPAVMRAIERAKEQILAQAYLQKKIGSTVKPSKAEVDDFFQKNPDLFAQRKQFELNELIIDTERLTPELNAVMGKSKSLDEVAMWLEEKKTPFERVQVTRTSTDLPSDMAKALKNMAKGHLFTVKEGARSVLIALHDVKEAPVGASIAAPQIEQYLVNTKNKESGEAEIARLRAAAKIEYLNESVISKDKSVTPTATPAAVAEVKPVNVSAESHIGRGVAGLK